MRWGGRDGFDADERNCPQHLRALSSEGIDEVQAPLSQEGREARDVLTGDPVGKGTSASSSPSSGSQRFEDFEATRCAVQESSLTLREGGHQCNDLSQTSLVLRNIPGNLDDIQGRFPKFFGEGEPSGGPWWCIFGAPNS